MSLNNTQAAPRSIAVVMALALTTAFWAPTLSIPFEAAAVDYLRAPSGGSAVTGLVPAAM